MSNSTGQLRRRLRYLKARVKEERANVRKMGRNWRLLKKQVRDYEEKLERLRGE